MLSVRNLAVSFGTVDALKGVSFEVPENTTVALVGESGSGKSTAALSILGLLPDNATVRGELSLEGRDLLRTPLRKIRGGEIGMVFQEPMTSLNPLYTVGGQIAEAVALHQGLSRREAWDRAVEMLRRVYIPEPEKRAHAYPHQLSGGMRQRVMIAMALSCNPKVLIADEPTTALDVTIQAQILDLMRDLQETTGNRLGRRSRRGRQASSAFVYGSRGAANTAFAGPCSRISPARITATWSAMSPTSPRSCVM